MSPAWLIIHKITKDSKYRFPKTNLANLDCVELSLDLQVKCSDGKGLGSTGLGKSGMYGRGTLTTRNQSNKSSGRSGKWSTYCCWEEGNIEQRKLSVHLTVLKHFCFLDGRRSRVWMAPLPLQEHLYFESKVSSFNWIVFEFLTSVTSWSIFKLKWVLLLHGVKR